jgi:hypothetical protein
MSQAYALYKTLINIGDQSYELLVDYDTKAAWLLGTI